MTAPRPGWELLRMRDNERRVCWMVRPYKYAWWIECKEPEIYSTYAKAQARQAHLNDAPF